MLGQKFTTLFWAIALSGCAIQPVPKDFGTNIVPKGKGEMTATTAIVQRVRCEARYAIAKVTMGFLKSDFEVLEDKYRTEQEDVIYQALLDRNNRLSFDQLINNFYTKGRGFDRRLSQVVKGSGDNDLGAELNIISAFAGSGVGYQFEFEITVNNDVTGGLLSFKFLRTNGSTTLGLGGDYKRARKNVRRFKIAETIEEIVLDIDLRHETNNGEMYCNEHDFSERANYHFPIYGKVDLLDSFSTFAGIIVKANIGDPDKEIGNSAFGKFAGQDLRDEISFTTELSGTANPAITLNPLTNSLNLASGKVGLTNKRSDIHRLTLILQENGVGNILEKLELERLEDDGNSIIAVPVN